MKTWSEWIITRERRPETGMYVQVEEGRRGIGYPPPAECLAEGFCDREPKKLGDPTNGFIGMPKVLKGVRPPRPYCIRWRYLIDEDESTQEVKKELWHEW